MNTAPFIALGKSVLIAATNVSSSVAVPSDTPGANQYMLQNQSAVDAWMVAAGPAGQAISAATAVIPTAGTAQYGFYLLARQTVVVSAPPNAQWSGITASGTANVYITPGDGA